MSGRALARVYPRHVLLAGLVAGLLLGPLVAAPAVVAVALAAPAIVRGRLGLALAAAVLAGAGL
ncbi:MAG: hypothetical protein M3P39_07455, partial [Actinomycetota bacterium]|nr:hypothetical protein [Actinomycetota bacterium]